MELSLRRHGYTQAEIDAMDSDAVEERCLWLVALQQHAAEAAEEDAWVRRQLGGG